jgi:hypothetical protein
MASLMEVSIDEMNACADRKRWTRGAHLVLQARTRVLNDDLDQLIHRRYPAFRKTAGNNLPRLVMGSSCGSRHQSSVKQRLLAVRIISRSHLEFLAHHVAVVVVIRRADWMQ